MLYSPPPASRKLPGFRAIQHVGAAAKARFVFADHAIQAVVHRHGVRRRAIVKVEDRHAGVRVVHFPAAVGDVHRDQVPVRKVLFGGDDRVHDLVLPVERHAAEIRLVANFVVQIVVVPQLLDELAGQGDLDLQQVRMLQRVDFFPAAVPHAVDVVRGVHRAGSPQLVVVHRAEQIEFDDHAALAGLRQEIVQPGKIGRVVFRQIEPVATVEIARRFAACPGAGKAIRMGRQRVVGDPERARDFAIGAGKRPRVIQSVGLQRAEVHRIVEIQIQDRAVVFPGGDQDRRLAAPEEIVRVVRMQLDRHACGVGGQQR